jgi:hypothetical protein
MHRHSDIEHDGWAHAGDAPVWGSPKQDLLAHDLRELGALHLALNKKIVRARQRLNTPVEAGYEITGTRSFM